MELFWEYDMMKKSEAMKMRRPLNQLYDDFFSVSTPTIKEETIQKEEQIIQSTYPNKQHQLNNYVLGQEKAMQDLENGMKRPQLMQTNLNTILVCGPKGSGKHTLLKTMHEYLYTENYLSQKHPTYIALDKIVDEMTFIQDLYSALQKPRQMIVFENIELASIELQTLIMDLCEDGILPLKQRYSIQKDKLTLAQSQLEKNLVSSLNANQHFFLLLTNLSYSKISSQLGNHFIDIIQDVIETSVLSKETYLKLIDKDLLKVCDSLKEQFHLDIQITDYAKNQLCLCATKENGYHDIIKTINDLHHEMVNCLLTNPINPSVLDYHNSFIFNTIPLLQQDDLQKTLADIQKEMDDIVGLEEVKKYIYSLRDLIQINKRRKAQGLSSEEVSMHMIFTGNPGTGKTTMARLMAKYLKALGVLKNGQLIEVTRADLVASYVGQTAPKTKQVIEASLGGVLFIDEAYSLFRGKEDSFGLEAIDMIVKCMEDYRDNLVVVLAGYTKEMATFLEANSGLKSRFANTIEFPDYTAEQLLAIALSQANKKQYTLTKEAQAKILDYFGYMQALQDKRSGNGRMARNVIEDAILKQASRIANDLEASLTELIADDFELDV